MANASTVRVKRHMAKRISEGRCLMCGSLVDRKGVHCSKCREKNQTLSREYRKRKRSEGHRDGTCNICGKPRVGETVVCEKHWFMNVAKFNLGSTVLHQALKEKLVEQEYRCYYTGHPLLIGVNIALDHRLSVANRPDLKSDIENVVWCLKNINIMKNSMNETDFL